MKDRTEESAQRELAKTLEKTTNSREKFQKMLRTHRPVLRERDTEGVKAYDWQWVKKE